MPGSDHGSNTRGLTPGQGSGETGHTRPAQNQEASPLAASGLASVSLLELP